MHVSSSHPTYLMIYFDTIPNFQNTYGVIKNRINRDRMILITHVHLNKFDAIWGKLFLNSWKIISNKCRIMKRSLNFEEMILYIYTGN